MSETFPIGDLACHGKTASQHTVLIDLAFTKHRELNARRRGN
jgi:hypothetical protein